MAEAEKNNGISELRRDVSVWGSFMWGFADVGADIFLALGLVLAASQGAGGFAFAFAGLVYILIGMAYTELASTYPVAGGGQFFTLRGLGDFAGFIAGSALLLDYTIDIALFAMICAGYINFFIPILFGVHSDAFVISFGPIHNFNYLWCSETILIIFILMLINIRGIRESSLVNEIIGVMVILLEVFIIVAGFILVWDPTRLIQQIRGEFPSLSKFMYGSSLAIISFVGLESISQAAQETKRPATIIPRTSIALTLTVFLFAVAFSHLALGVLPWQELAEHQEAPIARLVMVIPYIGFIGAPLTAFLGAIMLFISANSGVMSASRLTYSMSQLHLIPRWFRKVHPSYRTPVRTIIVFSSLGMLLALFAFLVGRGAALDVLANMYAFGATLGYTLVFISLMKLRVSDPYSPRPYRMPLNLTLQIGQRRVDFPILGIVGILGVMTVLFEVILTHAIGRIAGPLWVLLSVLGYWYFRKSRRLPLFKSIPRNWESMQKEVLESAEEFELLEQYKVALLERDREIAGGGT